MCALAIADMPSTNRWTPDELATLRILNKQAHGKLKEVIRLAAVVGLDRSPKSIRDKRCDLALDRRSRQKAIEEAHGDTTPEQHSPTIPATMAPARCPHCGGTWRLDYIPEDGTFALVCWSCAKTIHVLPPVRVFLGLSVSRETIRRL